ncbi:MAG: hypothetical protein J6Y45_07340 [Bacteroidales bacterium]|nr:hypothetical protein [Bacteroidales bacterium]
MNDFVVSLLLLGAISSNDNLNQMPFWATTDQFGVMPESNGALALLRAGTSFDESRTFQWRWGTSLGFRSDWMGEKVLIDELNASLRYRKLRLDLGMIHPEQDFMASDATLGTLSVTGGNFMMSGNARTLPGYALRLEPWDVPFTNGHLQLYGRFGDYSTLGKRYMQGALVHNTALYARIKAGEHLSFTAGFDHYSLWAGSNPEQGVQPHSFLDYLRVLTGSSGGSDASLGDQVNSLGDHRGRELLRVDYKADSWSVCFQHDIPYDDRSGMIFRNFPDGVNTLCFSFSDKSRWVSDIVYEYHYTLNQSGDCERRLATEAEIASGSKRLYLAPYDGKYYMIVGGADNYCNNFAYRSGWSAFTRQLGNPLFYSRYIASPDDPAGYIMQGTGNNMLQAHHFAVSGSLFRKIPYRLVATYSLNYGCYFDAEGRYNRELVLDKPLRQFSAGLNAMIPCLKGALHIIPGIYFDQGELLSNCFGATLSLKYNLLNNKQI